MNYIKNQIGFHELVYYDEIKRGNIENQLTQTSGLKWVQHFKREHDFAVHFAGRNLVVAGLCSDGGGCTLKYFRDGSGILIGENNLDLNFEELLIIANTKIELFNSLAEKAAKLNVFGSPTYVLNKEIYWGQDRLSLLEEHIQENL